MSNTGPCGPEHRHTRAHARARTHTGAISGDRSQGWQKLQSLCMLLRQCCNHPYMLAGMEETNDDGSISDTTEEAVGPCMHACIHTHVLVHMHWHVRAGNPGGKNGCARQASASAAERGQARLGLLAGWSRHTRTRAHSASSLPFSRVMRRKHVCARARERTHSRTHRSGVSLFVCRCVN